MAKLVRAPAHRAGDPGSNPGPGENFSLKLLITIIRLYRRFFYNIVGILNPKQICLLYKSLYPQSSSVGSLLNMLLTPFMLSSL